MKKQGLKLVLELFIVFLGVSGGFFLNNWGIQQDEIELEDKYLNVGCTIKGEKFVSFLSLINRTF